MPYNNGLKPIIISFQSIESKKQFLSSNDGKQFIAQVWCQGQSYGRGVGRTKKEAEQAAAKESLSMIKTH